MYRSPGKYICRMAKTQLGRELSRILADLMALEKDNDQHPAVKQLFKWLADPQRTAEEFSYAIGKLSNNVSVILKEHFPTYLYQNHRWVYMCKTSAQTLGVNCPILEDPWKLGAWPLVLVIEDKQDGCYRVACQHLSNWIQNVIGCPDIKNTMMLCHNPPCR